MDINQIMKQAQIMQKKLLEAQEQQVGKEFEGSAVGGKVSATVAVVKIGQYRVKKVKIDPEFINVEESDIMEDLIVTAINAALKAAEEDGANTLGSMSSMMGLPAGFKLPF